MSVKGIGIDIVEVERFRTLKGGKRHPFIKKIFTVKEIAYCFSYKDHAPHLAGIFASKEAVSKSIGASNIFLSDIEILHGKNGVPEAWVLGKKRSSIRVSLTHICTLALAIALRQ